MAENKISMPAGEDDPADVEQQTTTDGSLNTRAKELPWVKDMATELAALRKEKEERQTAATKAQEEAELNRLKEEQRFEEALQKQQQQAEANKLAAEQKIQRMELQFELATAGFSKRGIDLLVNEYNAESGSITEYVEAAKESESNKSLLADVGLEKSKPIPPGKSPVNGGGGAITPEQAKAWEHSSDPEQKKQAKEFLDNYYRKYRKFPD